MPAPAGNITIALDDYRLFVHFAGGRVIQTIRAIEIKDRAGHESYLFFSALPPIRFLTLTGPSELGHYAAGGMGVRNTDSSQAHGCVPPMTLTTSASGGIRPSSSSSSVSPPAPSTCSPLQ